MLELELAYEDGRCCSKVFPLPMLIGRSPDCALVLKSWRVARHHARIVARGALLFLEDLGGLAGTYVNGHRVTEHGPVSLGDEIIIGPCRMRVMRLPATDQPDLPERLDPSVCQRRQEDADQPLVRCNTEASNHSDTAANAAYIGTPLVAVDTEGVVATGTLPATHMVLHRRRLHKALLEALDLRRRDILALSDEALRREAMAALSAILADDHQLPAGFDREQMLRQVIDEAVGLGPLEPLLADHTISEIMVNSHDEIYVERAGNLQRHQATFSSEQSVIAIIDRIVAPIGRRVDEASPMVDARLRDGSRVNAVIPPIALKGACLTIRKFPLRRLEMQDLLDVGSLDRHMAEFLNLCVVARKSMLVSGGTGSGKTTLLNVLSNCIPVQERVVTIEDAAELRLNHAHLISLEARPANSEGKGRIEIRDLVRNALRMRPDRIIVGECRGAEAFDMLSAMNTGHEGSMTTLHANTPRDALARLETMILMAGMDLPLAAIREHIASAVDLVIQQTRGANGHRLVTSVVEITGMEAGRIQTQELFRYRNDVEPRFEGCGVRPECLRDGEHTVPLEWLTQSTPVAQGGRRTWQ